MSAHPNGAPVRAARFSALNAAIPGGWRSIVSLLVLSAITALNNIDRSLFSLLLPEVQKTIPLDDAVIGLLLGPAFMVVYSFAGLPIASLADRMNRRTIIAVGLTVWSLATAATAAATRPVHLLLLRGALGLGEATNIAPSTALIGDLFPVRQRALAFAVISVGTPLGMLLFFPFVGRISATQGWQAAFVAMGLIGLMLSGVAMLLVRDPRHSASASGSALAADKLGKAAVGSVWVECVRALRHRPFRRLVLAGAFFSCNYSAMTVWTPSFLARAHGLSVQEIGATLSIYRGAFGIAASLLGGTLVSLLAGRNQRWIAWVPAIFGALIVPAELMLLASSSRAVWLAGLGMDTFFLTAAIPATFTLLAHVAEPRARALWAACYFLVFNLIGQSLGPFSVGVLSEWLAPSLSTQSLRVALLIAPVSMGCACWMFLQLASAMRSEPAPSV